MVYEVLWLRIIKDVRHLLGDFLAVSQNQEKRGIL